METGLATHAKIASPKVDVCLKAIKRAAEEYRKSGCTLESGLDCPWCESKGTMQTEVRPSFGPNTVGKLWVTISCLNRKCPWDGTKTGSHGFEVPENDSTGATL